jgi:hypothetical protein
MSDVDRSWSRVGQIAGYVAAAGFVAGTVLYLLDATDALGAGPSYRATAAGPLQDEANFWVAYFAHQHDILWDVVARDTIFPVAFMALIVLSLAIRHVVGPERPAAQMMTTFFVVGSVLSILSDLIYLSAGEYWRVTGWSAGPPAKMVAVGRSSGSLEALNRWPEAAGFIALAAALVCLGALCRSGPQLPSAVGVLACLEALLLIGAALGSILHSDTAYDVFSLLTGAVIGPAVAAWIAWRLGRRLAPTAVR